MGKSWNGGQPTAAGVWVKPAGRDEVDRRRDHDGGDIADWPHVLLLSDLAALLRCSESTIKRRLRAGVFPVAPLAGIDRKYRWSRAAVWKWFVSGEANGLVSRRRPGRNGGR